MSVNPIATVTTKAFHHPYIRYRTDSVEAAVAGGSAEGTWDIKIALRGSLRVYRHPILAD